MTATIIRLSDYRGRYSERLRISTAILIPWWPLGWFTPRVMRLTLDW
jgi:hypothetical protein